MGKGKKTIPVTKEHTGISVIPGSVSGIALCVVSTYPAMLILYLVDVANVGCLQARRCFHGKYLVLPLLLLSYLQPRGKAPPENPSPHPTGCLSLKQSSGTCPAQGSDEPRGLKSHNNCLHNSALHCDELWQVLC